MRRLHCEDVELEADLVIDAIVNGDQQELDRRQLETPKEEEPIEDTSEDSESDQDNEDSSDDEYAKLPDQESYRLSVEGFGDMFSHVLSTMVLLGGEVASAFVKYAPKAVALGYKAAVVTLGVVIKGIHLAVKESKLSYQSRVGFYKKTTEELESLLSTLDAIDNTKAPESRYSKNLLKLSIKGKFDPTEAVFSTTALLSDYSASLQVLVSDRLHTLKSLSEVLDKSQVTNPKELMKHPPLKTGFVKRTIPAYEPPSKTITSYVYNKPLPAGVVLIAYVPTEFGSRDDVRTAYNKADVFLGADVDGREPIPAKFLNKSGLLDFINTMKKACEHNEAIAGKMHSQISGQVKFYDHIKLMLGTMAGGNAKAVDVNEVTEYTGLLLRLHDKISVKFTKKLYAYEHSVLSAGLEFIKANVAALSRD